MSSFDALVAAECPNGVEYKLLGDVGSFVRGNGLQKKDLTDEGMPAIHYGQIFTIYGTSAAETKSFVDPAVGSRLRRALPGDLVVATTSENDDDVCKAVAWMGSADVAVSGDAYIFSHTLDPLYVAYFFQSGQFASQKMRHITGAKVRRVSGADLAKIRIPVPSRAIQKEVARILLTLEALQVSLREELAERLAQYSYYRDLLTEFAPHQVEFVALGEVASVLRGASPRPIKNFVTDAPDGVNWIKIGDVPANSKYVTRTAERIKPEGVLKSRRVEPGDFILSNSMSFGRPYIMQTDGCIHDGWLAIKDFSGTFDADFLYHLLRSSAVYAEMDSKAGSGTVRNLNADIVKALVLPVPPLDEQRRIAAILDKFDALVNDPDLGIPAEIEARRQQFEYYRDRLLNFAEKESAA